MVAAVTALGPGGVRGAAVVASRVLDDLHEADRAGRKRGCDGVGHPRVPRGEDADVLELADRRLCLGEPVARRLGAEHRPAVDLPCDFVLVAADLRETGHDVRQRVPRRPPQERRVGRGGDEQLTLSVDDHEGVGVAVRLSGGARYGRDHTVGDARGGTALAAGRGHEAEEGREEGGDERGDESDARNGAHGGLRVGGKSAF